MSETRKIKDFRDLDDGDFYKNRHGYIGRVLAVLSRNGWATVYVLSACVNLKKPNDLWNWSVVANTYPMSAYDCVASLLSIPTDEELEECNSLFLSEKEVGNNAKKDRDTFQKQMENTK